MHRATTYCAAKHPNDGGTAEEHEDGRGCDCGGTNSAGKAHESEGRPSAVGAASTCPLCSCHTGERKDWKTLCVKSGETHELNAGRRCCFAAAAAAAADATTTTIY